MLVPYIAAKLYARAVESQVYVLTKRFEKFRAFASMVGAGQSEPHKMLLAPVQRIPRAVCVAAPIDVRAHTVT